MKGLAEFCCKGKIEGIEIIRTVKGYFSNKIISNFNNNTFVTQGITPSLK